MEVTVVQVSVARHSPELTEKNHETPWDNVSRSRSEMGISRVQVISVTFLWTKTKVRCGVRDKHTEII
jgi:hypothetical protein